MKKLLIYLVSLITVIIAIIYGKASFQYLDFVSSYQFKDSSLVSSEYQNLTKNLPLTSDNVKDFLKELKKTDLKYNILEGNKAVTESQLQLLNQSFGVLKEKLSFYEEKLSSLKQKFFSQKPKKLKNKSLSFLKLELQYLKFLLNLFNSSSYNPDYIMVSLIQLNQILDLILEKVSNSQTIFKQEKRKIIFFFKRYGELFPSWRKIVDYEENFWLMVLKEFSRKHHLSYLVLKMTGKLPTYRVLKEIFSNLKTLPLKENSWEKANQKLKFFRRKLKSKDLVLATLGRIPWEKFFYLIKILELKKNFILSSLGEKVSDPFDFQNGQPLQVDGEGRYYSVGKNGNNNRGEQDDIKMETVSQLPIFSSNYDSQNKKVKK